MGFSFNGIFLPYPEPRNPVQVSAPDAKSLYFHSGEDEAQYETFLQAVNALANMFKFLPEADQMKYQYINPLLLYAKEPRVTRDYVEALIVGMSDTDKNTFRDWCEILIGTKEGDRLDAATQLKVLSDNFIENTFSKQKEISRFTKIIYGKGTDKYSLGKKNIVDGSELIYVDGTLQLKGVDYTITNSTGEIIFINGPVAEGAEISVEFNYESNDMWGKGAGVGYSNLIFSPDASCWDMIDDDIDMDFLSIFDEINTYFDWDAIKMLGDGLSYYQLAKTLDLNNCTDEYAFNLMCSMLESRERVLGTFQSIFGDPTDTDIMANIQTWLNNFTEVDPHNLGILKMFFSMQTDFINTVDAYINCDTYWGGDLINRTSTTEFGGFSDLLKTRVQSYIESLTGDKKTAAQSLMAMWFCKDEASNLSLGPRWDTVGGKWSNELIGLDGDWKNNSSGTWMEFFWDRMDKCTSEEVCRVFLVNIMNHANKRDYEAKKKEYNEKVDDIMSYERFLAKLQAKKKSENSKLTKRIQKKAGTHKANGAKRTSRVMKNNMMKKHRAAKAGSQAAKHQASIAAKARVSSQAQRSTRPASVSKAAVSSTPKIPRAPAVSSAPKAQSQPKKSTKVI